MDDWVAPMSKKTTNPVNYTRSNLLIIRAINQATHQQTTNQPVKKNCCLRDKPISAWLNERPTVQQFTACPLTFLTDWVIVWLNFSTQSFWRKDTLNWKKTKKSNKKHRTYFEVTGNIGPSQNTGGRWEEDGEDLEETVVDAIILPEVRSKVLHEHIACETQSSIKTGGYPQCQLRSLYKKMSIRSTSRVINFSPVFVHIFPLLNIALTDT